MFTLPIHHTPPLLVEDMTPWQLYGGLRGRINRRSFWLHGVLALLLVGGVAVALLEIAGLHPDRAETLANLLIAWPAITISAKRWHDRDRAAWWVLITLVPLIGQLWALIDNGFLPGTRGENRFGAEPRR
ncbi:MAG TPA: DUF805 domain-containing protein [Ideonella sp.]|uniref:DUF805 domain-containing protein n=1 Tax=Ideonella sp. TaxID=1929293 RepID=UPI002E355D6E|nr:DUF805 domain-containing protein [Ideonella sp.]HEX5684423.1 DUF805 domain-containing protein [Ideonella sp.]